MRLSSHGNVPIVPVAQMASRRVLNRLELKGFVGPWETSADIYGPSRDELRKGERGSIGKDEWDETPLTMPSVLKKNSFFIKKQTMQVEAVTNVTEHRKRVEFKRLTQSSEPSVGSAMAFANLLHPPDGF